MTAPAIALTTTHSKLIFAFNTVCLALDLIAVGLRVYARHLKKLRFVAEDYLVFVALVGFVAQSTLTYCAVFYGAAGHPQSSVSPKNVETSLQILAGQGVCYGIAMTCSKWSICLLYKRIFVVKSFRVVTYIVMALILGWGILACLVTWAFCSPIAFGWDITIPGGHCADRDAGYLVVGVVDAVTDLIIVILPLPMIWKLQIPRMKQISLMVIFSIAILSTVVSAVRAYYTTLVTFEDFTDSRTLLDIFSAIEPATSIIVASSLVLGPVLKKWFGRDGYISKNNDSSTKRSFQRIMENNQTGDIGTLRPIDVELGPLSETTIEKGPKWTGLREPLEGYTPEPEVEKVLEEERRRRVRDGESIAVQREFTVHQGT